MAPNKNNQTVEKILWSAIGLLITIGGWQFKTLHDSTTKNSNSIAHLEASMVTKDALSGRLDRIDDKIESVRSMLIEYIKK